MTPLLLAAAGLAALVAGGLILRSFGARYRIGRLLATTPRVSVGEANQLAMSGRRAYVRVDGRIDAEDEFEDADHRPLVYRRVRLEAFTDGAWRAFEDHRRSVPFQVDEGVDSIGVDVAALDTGLIVVPRESVGRAADLPDRAPDRYGPDTTVRARIEQVSSVEHAVVLGYPVAVAPAAGGEVAADEPPADRPAVHLTAGRGRPLILTVLEPDEAMRILAAGGEQRTRWAAGLLGAGVVLLAGALLWALVAALVPAVVALVPGLDVLVSDARAASSEPAAVGGGDPRSDGQGPGLVGAPGIAILAVIGIGVAAALLTSLYVRLTRPSAPRPGRPDRPRRG
ncbi:MAG TPA: hypothetical protein VFK35_06140 [Candidatus Limnocylindrales bacterium]|nr:hypothetical protein [Candidatus Limnocylindrales bacterium]